MFGVTAPLEFRFDDALKYFPMSGSSFLLTLDFRVLHVVPVATVGSEPTNILSLPCSVGLMLDMVPVSE